MSKLNQLCLEAFTLAAGQEWAETPGGWRFVRLHRGAAYWLSPGLNRPLGEGEVLVIPPQAAGLVRASQVGDVQWHGFCFDPDRLCGFFTLTERHFLEVNTKNPTVEVQFLPSTHPVAAQFAAAVAVLTPDNPLPLRVSVLNLVAAVFQEQMSRHRAPVTVNSHQRFEAVIAKMPEGELMNYSPEALARLCGCSPRHFNRLFQQSFGTSARARQTELRLLKARQLLVASDEKIVHVALESGYRNLSLFNALFKKHFGMTPSQWRKNSAKSAPKLRGKSVRHAVLAVFAGLCAIITPLRADPPLATNAPAAAPVLTFRVDRYELDGNSLLPTQIYTPLLAKYTGEAITFETIRKALAELQMAYRSRGFVTVSVALPQQQLTNGAVKVKITEGRLVDVVVKNNGHYSTANILRALPSARTNTLLNGLVFQEELNRANANRDRQIYPVISPGPEPGTTALELRVKDRLPFHLRMELNNYATPKSPDLRLNVSAVHNNLWQRDHQFGVSYSLTPESLKDSLPTGVGDGVLPYDMPLIASYSMFYRMPLGPQNGYPREYQAADFGWDEVTRRFRPPPLSGAAELIIYASRSHSDSATFVSAQTLTPPVVPPGGTLQISDTTYSRSLTPNENLGFRLSKPLPVWGAVSSTVSFGLDFKNYRSTLLQNRVFAATLWVPNSGTNGYETGFTQFQSPPTYSTRSIFTSVQYLPINLTWSGALTDKAGVTTFEIGQSFNFAALVSRKSDFQAVTGNAAVDGNFYVVTAGLTRDQKIWQDWGIRLHADGQWANQQLVSNEQFGLGGQAGVRGYLDGRQYGDRGWRVQFEPHSPYINIGYAGNEGNTVPTLVRFYSFADYGQTFSLNPAAAPGAVSLLGVGCGADVSFGEHFDFRVQLGVPLLGVPGATTSEPVHISFSLAAQL